MNSPNLSSPPPPPNRASHATVDLPARVSPRPLFLSPSLYFSSPPPLPCIVLPLPRTTRPTTTTSTVPVSRTSISVLIYFPPAFIHPVQVPLPQHHIHHKLRVNTTTRSTSAFFLDTPPFALPPPTSSSPSRCSPLSCRRRRIEYRPSWTACAAQRICPASTNISRTFAVRRSGDRAANRSVI